MSNKLNILNCDQACTSCIKAYSKKHNLKKGDEFKISCNGIPKEYLSSALLESIATEDISTYLASLDPVTWASEYLDWHCEDPDGEIWKRKTLQGTLGEVTPYIEEQHSELVKQGKSAFNRPYQSTLLRCTAKRKVLRLGRQLGKTETICINILHALYTNKNYRAIILTPYQTQIELIFNRLDHLIRTSPKTSNSLKRYVKAPNFTIELHNGSRVSGFTAGTKSGGNADAIRGQKANLLCMDEADYLASADMASALALITNYPDARVWMSSTPTGKHERFYEVCKSPLWKEYYYPSMMNPLWNKDLEDFFRGEYTDIQYEHEILANFGEQEQGVYQNAYIEDAMIDYKYEDMQRDPNWLYLMGVDWNDEKVGTTIAVVGYNPVDNIFKLFNRYVVSREGWTQTAAIEKIIELNRYWLPKSIYIDKGFGGVQWELIKQYGFDSLANKNKGASHPDSKLHRITKQYDFGSKLTIKDPHTKQDIDKPSKPFLVENSIRRFEQRTFQFSKYDTQLESELRGYIIDHRTVSGAPVYKQGNEKVGDHNLDALNLALVAYALEFTQFGQVKYESHINFAPNFSQFEAPRQPSANSQLMNPNQPVNTAPQKPDMNRSNFGGNSVGGVNNSPAKINKEQRRLWAWPGFERDAPRPTSRVPGGVMSKRPLPPSRKKI